MTGGMFDRLHDGHRRLFDALFEKCDFVTLFLGEAEPKMRYAKLMQSYNFRERAVKKYWEEKGYSGRGSIVFVPKPSGLKVVQAAIKCDAEVIFTGDEGDCGFNIRTINFIENEREKLGRTIIVETVPLVLDGDGEKLSSSKMRAKEKGLL